MAKRAESVAAALLGCLSADPAARLVRGEDGRHRVGQRVLHVSEAALRHLVSAGLLSEAGAGTFRATDSARAWLRRRGGADHPFRQQHGTVVEAAQSEEIAPGALIDLDESPIAALTRRIGKGGVPWLQSHAATAAERLRRDFEIGRLQPRVTANWSAAVSQKRRSGDGSGLADLTDMALAARLRFDRAMRAVGPELSGVLVDVCCFLKGLETVERERQWPARSAKLVLRIALDALARHYGLAPAATGNATAPMRHWGTEGYRPEIM